MSKIISVNRLNGNKFQKSAVRPNIAQSKQIHREFRANYTINSFINSLSHLARLKSLSADELLQSYETNPYVRAAVGWTARNVAKLPYKIVNLDTMEDEKDDPLFKVFRKPHRDQTRSEFMEGVVIDYMCVGNALFEPKGSWDILFGKKEKFKVKELIPLDPRKVMTKVNQYGFIEAVNEHGITGEYHPDKLIFIREASSSVRKMGVGRVKAAEHSILLMAYMDSFANSFFEQGGYIDLYFTTPEELDDKAMTNAKQRVAEQFGGIKTWHKKEPQVFSKSLEPKTLDMQTPLNAGINAAKTECKHEIFAACGTPNSIFEIENSNFNTAETGLRAGYDQVVMPITNRIDEEFTELLPEGYEYKTDYSGVEVLQRDKAKFKEYAVKGWMTDLLTRNEARAQGYELDEVSDETGDMYLSEIRGGDAGVSALSLNGGKPSALPAAKDDDELDKKFEKSFSKGIKSMMTSAYKSIKIKTLPARFKSDIEKEKKELDGIRHKLETKHFELFKDYIDDITNQAQEIIKSYDQIDESNLDDVSAKIEAFIAGMMIGALPIVKEVSQEAAALGFGHVSNKIGKSVGLDLASESLAAFIQERFEIYDASVGKALSESIKRTLKDGIKQKLSFEEIATMLQNKFVSSHRAKMLNQTVVNSALNFGAHESMVVNGVEFKMWLHQNNQPNPRPEHVLMDNEIRRVGQTFSNGEMFPTLRNCKCWVTAVNLKALDFTPEEAQAALAAA